MNDTASAVVANHEESLSREGLNSSMPPARSIDCSFQKESNDIEASLPSGQTSSQGSRFRSLFARSRDFLYSLISRGSSEAAPSEDNPKAQYVKWTENFINKDYRKFPRGWPQVAAFLDSCDSFSMYRRFGTSHSRILVDYMVDITSIEQKLRDLDQRDLESVGDNDTSYRLETRDRMHDTDSVKINLMRQLESKLSVYDDLLLKHHQLKLLPQSTEADHGSVAKWIWLEKPLCEGQYDFIYRHKDFVTLGTPSHNRFEDGVKNVFSLWLGSWFKNYIGMESLNDPNDKSVQYYSADRVTFFARLCVVFFAVLILYAPVVLFLLASLDQLCMAVVILAFVFVFSIILSLLSEARVMDIFLGSATYCAVLLTFLGNLQGATN